MRSLSAIFLIALLVSGCEEKEKPLVEPPSVTVVKVAKGDVASSMEIIGQTKAYDEVDLVARVQGFLTKIAFTEGSAVSKGQLLFQIEPDQYQAEVEAAEASLMNAKAVFDNAEINFNRQKKLFDSKVVSEKNYDDANATYTEAKANVMAAQASLSNAKLNLSYTTINSPFDGRIGFFTYSEGNLVGSASKRLANVVKLDPVRVQFNINEVDLLGRRLEKSASDPAEKSDYTVLIRFQNGKIYDQEGKLSFIDNKVNSSTGTILVEALFPNPNSLLIPGMYVKVIIKDKEQKPALLIPQTAIQENQSGEFVLVVNPDGKVAQRVIRTGIKTGPSIEVVEGLKEGELVLVEGLQKVRLGAAVKTTLDDTYTFNSPDSGTQK